MEWWIWFAWWILSFCRYPRLLWIYHQKHETLAGSFPVQIYPIKIKNRIALKVKTGYKLELLSTVAMKLLGSTKKDVDQDEDGENLPKL